VAGNDDIPDYVVKECVDFVMEPLTHIINCSFTEAVVPKGGSREGAMGAMAPPENLKN